MLSYINIRKIWIIFLKMIILEYIKDCFKSIHVAYLCYFSYKFTYIIVMFSFLTQTGWEWEKSDTEAHMRIKYLLSCFVSALLRCLVSFSALYVPNKNSASRSWCFAAVCGWVISPVMSLYYHLSAPLHTDLRSAPVALLRTDRDPTLREWRNPSLGLLNFQTSLLAKLWIINNNHNHNNIS